MDRVYKSGGTAVVPSAADNASGPNPRAGDPGTGTPATKPGPYWFYMITEEIAQFILASGLVLDKTVVTQVRDALRRMRDSASKVVGCDCKNNAGTPNTQFDLDAYQIVLRNPATGDTVVVRNPAVKTVNILTAGPAANGRDQAGAFANSSWVHFYWIGKVDGSFDGIASASAEDVGPVLPAAYTHWAYAGAVRLDSGGALKKVRIKGATAFYEASQNVLAGGSATVETAVSVATQVPPNALSYQISVPIFQATPAANSVIIHNNIRVVTGVDYLLRFPYHSVQGGITGITGGGGPSAWLPNIGQQFFYILTVGSGTSQELQIDVTAYKLPNGGE